MRVALIRLCGWRVLCGCRHQIDELEMIRVTREQELDDATRAALASGRAHPSMRVFLDTLIEIRGISEHAGEALSGAMLEAETPATMSTHALDMVFAAIERGAPRASARAKRELTYPELATLPVALREMIRDAEGKRSWGMVGPGIRRLDLAKDGDLKLEMIRLDAGHAVPWHTHNGRELTLCVHGQYSDGLATYAPGDFSITDGTIRHQPKASDNAPAYALAVTDAGLRFEGLLGALQRLVGQ